MKSVQADGSRDSKPRAFLTGAFGNVGEWVLRELIALGYSVTCFDKAGKITAKKAARLNKAYAFKTIWGDLTDAQSVSVALENARPNVIAHVGAVIPPLSIKAPGLAYRVNVDGTRNLLEAARHNADLKRFVLVSSYSVHGPANPHRDPPLWTAETPVNPHDDYGRQKVLAEDLVKTSGLPFTIVRLCAVLPIAPGGEDPDTMRFSFVLPYDRRSQAIDVRDAGLAIAKACHVNGIDGRTFDVGGGDGWKMIGGDMGAHLSKALGMRPLPRSAYRMADPQVDASWFSENWVDTTDSQNELDYQKHTVDDLVLALKRHVGFIRFILPLFSGAISKQLLKQSPYFGKPQTSDPRPIAEAALELFQTRE